VSKRDLGSASRRAAIPPPQAFDPAIAAWPNPISRQLPKPSPPPQTSRAISRYWTLIWQGADGGKVSRAVGPPVDPSAEPPTELHYSPSPRSFGVLLVHITRSLSANAELNSVKKVALPVRPDRLSSVASGFAIRLSQRPLPGRPAYATTLILRGFWSSTPQHDPPRQPQRPRWPSGTAYAGKGRRRVRRNARRHSPDAGLGQRASRGQPYTSPWGQAVGK